MAQYELEGGKSSLRLITVDRVRISIMTPFLSSSDRAVVTVLLSAYATALNSFKITSLIKLPVEKQCLFAADTIALSHERGIAAS